MQFKRVTNQLEMMDRAKDLDSESVDFTNSLHIPMESYMKTAESISRASADGKDSAQHMCATKRCPVCDEELFEDMNICYGCLYDFSRTSSDREQGKYEARSRTQQKLDMHSNVLTSSEFLIHSEILDTKIRFSDQLWVGRSSSNDVVLHARSVSRNHIRIFINKDEILVEDCGATNEAKIHGRAIMDPVSVMVGDTIDVCGITFTRLS